MFTAALIVFRESLEAALFIGIVAAATRGLSGRGRWLAAGVGAGVIGALLLALGAQNVSAWADGVGQDLVNVIVLGVALVMLVWHCVWVSAHARELADAARRLGQSVQQGQRAPWALLVAVALAVLREGAETLLFVGGSLSGTAVPAWQVVLSGAAGLAAGVALGCVLYFGLTRIPIQRLFVTTNVLIALLAGSIASQLVKALGQAGLVEAWSAPLWDSSHLLAPDSALGTLLHALAGYEARPSGAQLGAYLAVLALIYAGSRLLAQAQPAR